MGENELDLELVKRVQDGDKSAFDLLVLKYQHRIGAVIGRFVPDYAESQDIAQESFIRAYRAIANFRGDSQFYTWLYRIAVNTCLDYKKKSRPEQAEDESVIDDLASTEPSPEQRYQSKEIGQSIQLALQKLPESLRAAIVLKEIEDLSYEEIAEVLHTSMGTVKSRISRAREELRRLLQKESVG